MGFNLPDLIIESVIRDGLENIRKNSSNLDNIFISLTSDYVKEKYGQEEIEKLKNIIETRAISIVHSFSETVAKENSISIQLAGENEAQNLAHLDDFEEDEEVTYETVTELQSQIRVSDVIITSYDTYSGIMLIDNSVDLSDAYPLMLFEDCNGVEWQITGVIKESGSKALLFEAGSYIDTEENGTIKSVFNYTQYEKRGILTNVQLTIGIHTKSALLTKYLYLLVKYFILSRKKYLIERNFINTSFSGSDFGRNMEYTGDHIFTRFLTVSGQIEDSWRGEVVTPIESNDTIVQVPRDVASNEEAGREDMTIQINDDTYQWDEDEDGIPDDEE